MIFKLKNLQSSKRTLLITLAVLIVCSIVYCGYRYYVHYQSRLYRMARALESIGELAEAIDALKTHLIDHPSDITAKVYLAELYETQKNYEKSSEIWRKVQKESLLRNEEHLVRRAQFSERNCFELLARTASDSARQALESGDLKKARKFYKIEYRYWLDWIGVKVPKDTSGINRTDLVCKFYIAPVCANLAMTYWMDKDYDKGEKHLEEAKWITFYEGIHPDFEKWMHEDFAEKLDRLASEEFDKSNYALARIHWAQAMKSYQAATVSGAPYDNVPRLRYNCALTYFFEGNYSQGQKLLSELREEFPDYESEKINEMIKDSKAMLFWQREESICKRAEKAFHEKRWPDARAYCREAINYLLKSGIKEDNEEICRLNYNIAMAYYNDFKYKEAKEVLNKLQRTKPNYNAEKIQELLNELRDY